MMQSLVNDAEQGGQLPRWEAANDVTYVTGGDSPVPAIASSYAFGARAFDAQAALKQMVRAATETANNRERPFLEDYLKLGYVPSEKDRISASRTLEYASDDFAAAQFARSLGDAQAAERFANLDVSELSRCHIHAIHCNDSGARSGGLDPSRRFDAQGDVRL